LPSTASAVSDAPTAVQSDSAHSSALREPSEPSTATRTLVKSSGIAALLAAFPLHALVLVLAAALLAGLALGLGYFGAQSAVNALVPEERRGEVTAASSPASTSPSA